MVALTSVTVPAGRPDRLAALRSAVADCVSGAAAYQLWVIWGWYEVKKRYRRSLLGPFWVTISTGVFVMMLGLIYGHSLGNNIEDYMPSVTIGVVLWNYISSVLNESCAAFMEGDSLVRQTAMPLTIYIFKVVWRNIIIMFHNFAIVLLVLLLYPHPLHLSALLIPLVLLFYCVIGVSTGLSLGLLCARFRDIPPIVASIVQVLFFATPIMWQAEAIPVAREIVKFNPLYYLIEVFRAPLMGQAAPAAAWPCVLALTAATGLVALLLLARCRDRLVYWL